MTGHNAKDEEGPKLIVAAVPNVVTTNQIHALLSSWINLVMLQLTSCLQEKGLLTVIVFRSLWLVKLFTKRRFIRCVQCMQGEYTVAITFARVLV